MKITGVVIALFLVLLGFGVAFAHTSTTSVAPADIFATSLSQSPCKSGVLATAGLYNEADYSISMPQLSDIYYENGYPIIYSTFSSSDSASTLFSQTAWVNFTNDYVFNAPTFGVSLTYTYYVMSGNSQYQTISNTVTLSPITPSQSNENYGPFQVFNNAFFKGALTGIVLVEIYYVISPVNDNPINSFATVSGTIYREVYIGQTSGSVSAPSPVADGQTFQITYSTGYGSTYSNNNVGPFYQLLIYGSTAFNGAALYKTINVNPDVSNGQVSFTMPSSAWAYSTNPDYNIWNIAISNGYFKYSVTTPVAVKSLSLVPPAPTITIGNTPSSGHWIWGDQVEVYVHTQQNSNSNEPILSIDVLVYTGSQESEPSYYVVGQSGHPAIVDVSNNNASFEFAIPDTTQSMFIQVNAFDAGGETSSWAYATIGQNTIFQNKSQATAVSIADYALEIGVIAAAVVGSVAIAYFAPIDMGTKIIIIVGYVAMWLIILNSYVPL